MEVDHVTIAPVNGPIFYFNHATNIQILEDIFGSIDQYTGSLLSLLEFLVD
jgi:hypothetical protein